jgi:hypothetical protein
MEIFLFLHVLRPLICEMKVNYGRLSTMLLSDRNVFELILSVLGIVSHLGWSCNLCLLVWKASDAAAADS